MHMKRPLWQLSCVVLGLSVMLAGCGSDQNSSPPQGSYKEMKTMVVDILKSDEGKKAVEEALTGQSSSGVAAKVEIPNKVVADRVAGLEPSV